MDHYSKEAFFLSVIEDDDTITYEVPQSLYEYVVLLENCINQGDPSTLLSKYPERFKDAKKLTH